MSNAHKNEETRHLIEEHKRNASASILFTAPVVELFNTYQKRRELVDALGDEINSIPSDVIPYGTLFYNELVFVFRAAWDEAQDKWFAEIDLATGMTEIGDVFIPHSPENPADDYEEGKDLATIH